MNMKVGVIEQKCSGWSSQTVNIHLILVSVLLLNNSFL